MTSFHVFDFGFQFQNMEEASEETGWKLVHGDVLRPPITMSMPFAVSHIQ